MAVAAYRLPRQGETGCLPYQLASTQADSEDFSLRLLAIGIGPSRTGIFRESRSTNVDGAIGAILADLGMNPAAFNGIFMIARTPGLVAHVIEEQTREKPMRRIDPVNHGYDGPAPRRLSGTSSA